MNWYAAEDKAKSVREVVVEVPQPRAVDSRFGMLMLGTKYHMLRANVWVTGFFRLEGDPGPYLMLRADGHVGRLKNKPFRVAFCFYRMKAGGLVAVFVDFPKLKIAGVPSAPYVLFEMIRGIDMEDERQRINDAINRAQLHICFAEGDGPGDDLPGGGWSGGAINASYDVLTDIDPQCREALNREWKSLLDYHASISSGRRDFQASIQQMESENPLTHNPIVDRSNASGADAAEATPSAQPHPQVLPFENLEHVVLFAAGNIESFDPSEETQRVLEDLTGRSIQEVSQKARFQLFRNSGDTVEMAKEGNVAIIAATELGVSLSDQDLPQRFIAGGLKSTERHFWDSEAGQEFAIVLLYGSEDAVTTAVASGTTDKKWWQFWKVLLTRRCRRTRLRRAADRQAVICLGRNRTEFFL